MVGEIQHEATTALNDALATAFETGDFKALGGLYAEDAVMLPARGRPIKGRDGIAAFWTGVRNRFKGMTFTTGEFRALGDDIARETGTYVMPTGDDQASPPSGKYLFVWQKLDGAWLLESSIWTRNAEQRGGRPGGAAQGGGGQGRGQGGGYRQAGGQGRQQGGGYGGGGGRQGGGQRGGIGGGQRGGGAGVGGGGGGIGGGRQGNQQQGRGRQAGGQGRGQAGGQSPYDGNLGLYSNLDE